MNNLHSVEIIGHRGFPFKAPENTKLSFEAALSAGADMLETDIRITGDGKLIISHDDSFARLSDFSGIIRNCSSTELKKIQLKGPGNTEDTPLLMEEALRLFPDVSFSVDLKDSCPEIVYAWVNLLKKTNSCKRCITASFNYKTQKLFRSILPDAPSSLSKREIAVLLLKMIFNIFPVPEKNRNILQIPEKYGCITVLTGKRAVKLKKKGWIIHVWTVDNIKDMERLASWGVDGIITNRPDLLKDIQNEKAAVYG